MDLLVGAAGGSSAWAARGHCLASTGRWLVAPTAVRGPARGPTPTSIGTWETLAGARLTLRLRSRGTNRRRP